MFRWNVRGSRRADTRKSRLEVHRGEVMQCGEAALNTDAVQHDRLFDTQEMITTRATVTGPASVGRTMAEWYSSVASGTV